MASDGAVPAPPPPAPPAAAEATALGAEAVPASEPVPAVPQEGGAEPMDTSIGAAAGATEVAPEPPKVPEPPKELEEPAADIAGPTLTQEAGFNTEDTTMNVVPSQRGNLLMMLTDGGMQYLLAGARANVGMKAGRYFYEVRIVEILDPYDSQGQYTRVVHPRNLLRLGFGTSTSSLLLGDSEEEPISFQQLEGHFIHSRNWTPGVTQRFGRDQVMAVLLNLDPKSPNANTISLFRDGIRVSQPMPLPENLKGKTLFPIVTFRNITLSMNLGGPPKADFPFKCHMLGKGSLQDRAESEPVFQIFWKDLEVAKAKVASDGKFEVLFPILLPDEGTFDAVDLFLQQHPEYTELSDRMILEWCEKSGIQRSRGYQWRPLALVTELDNFSIRRALRSIAPAQKRIGVVNSAAGKDLELLSRFAGFKKIAQVLVGDPTSEFKKRTQQLILRDKQEKSDVEFKAKQAEEIKKYQMLLKEKELERAAKKARREQEKKAEEERRAAAGEEAPDQEMKPEDGAG
eukprot:g28222.t1